MAHHRTLVLQEHVADQLHCTVKSEQSCAANCVGCGQSRTAEPVRVSLPASLIASSDHTIGSDGSFELSIRGEMLIALSSLVYLSPVVLMLLFCAGCSVLYPGQESRIALAAAIGLGIGLTAVGLGGDRFRQKLSSHMTVRSCSV